MKKTVKAICILLPALAGLAQAAGIGGAPNAGGQDAGNIRLKQRQTHARSAQQQALNAMVLQALADMPGNGGYSVGASAAKRLANQAVVWNEADHALKLNLKAAQPSFCSAACYIALLRSLQLWQQSGAGSLPPAAWKAMDVALGTPDGKGVWGRANANGPGFAKLVHDLGAGVNFTELQQARAGDFLKFFWNGEIGARERGHIVVFLGTAEVDGQPAVRYWSANKPDGFSERTVPLAKMHHLIFTRITKPENFANAAKLPESDAWLHDMQKASVPFDEVCKRCGIAAAATPQPPQNPSSRDNQ